MWLNINGNWIGRHSGKSWSSYWNTLISATVEDAAPNDFVLTFATGKPTLDESKFTIAGFPLTNAVWVGAVLTLTSSTAVVYGDAPVITFVPSGGTANVTNNVAAEAELTTYITGLTTPLSISQRRKTNEFIKALKTGLSITNLSDAFDVIYLLAGETSESSLKNLVKDAHHGTLEGTAPTFTADLGFQNSGSGYIDTHYNPATEANKYLLESCAVGWYSNTGTNTPALQSVYGLGVANNYIVTNINGQEVSLIMNCLAGTSINYNNLQQGTFIFSRTAASVTALYKDKSLDLTDNDTRVAIPNGNIYVLARNLSGTADRFINKQISFFFISKGLIQVEVDAITDAFTGFFFDLTYEININPYDLVDFDTYNQYKANLHTHTDQSDADAGNTVQAVAETYSTFGYNVLAITDHDTYPDLDGIPTWPLSDFSAYEPSVETAGSNAEYYPDLSLLMIKGNELSGNPTTVHHRGALFCDIWTPQQILDGDFAAYRNDIPWTLAKINEMGGLSILNHPNYHTGYDLAFYTGLLNSITNLLGIEIYNGQVVGNNEDLWDEILVAEMPIKNVWGLSTTDDHKLVNQCGKHYCMILTDELTGAKIKSALQNGHFYFVYDPVGTNIARHNPVVTPIINNIIINADKNLIRIDTSNASKTEWIYNKEVVHEGDTFNPRSEMSYVRARITGANGSLTFTQPFGIRLKP